MIYIKCYVGCWTGRPVSCLLSLRRNGGAFLPADAIMIHGRGQTRWFHRTTSPGSGCALSLILFTSSMPGLASASVLAQGLLFFLTQHPVDWNEQCLPSTRACQFFGALAYANKGNPFWSLSFLFLGGETHTASRGMSTQRDKEILQGCFQSKKTWEVCLSSRLGDKGHAFAGDWP